MQKELFYVAASRGREQVLVITSDKERLRESVGNSMARLSASELVRKCGASLYQGMRRGRAMACKLAMLAAAQASISEFPMVPHDSLNKDKVVRKHEHDISR
jgi:predicted RNA-binding protein with PIN domain